MQGVRKYFAVLDKITRQLIFHSYYFISQKTPSLRLSLREFQKNLSNICIYKSIFIKFYVNANIINTQIVYLIKYDLKGHLGSQNSTFIFILSLTCDLMDNFFICPCHIMLQIQIFPQSSFLADLFQIFFQVIVLFNFLFFQYFFAIFSLFS